MSNRQSNSDLNTVSRPSRGEVRAANDNLMDIIDAAVYLGVSPSHLSRHKRLLPPPASNANGRAAWGRADIDAARGSIPPEDRYWERTGYRAGKAVKKSQVRGVKGTEAQFWRHIDKRSDTEWIWTGRTNNNHNTADTKNYDYGVFALEGCDSELVHRIMIYLTYGRELTRSFDVFAYDGNRLNVHPDNLGVRNVRSRHEQSAADYFSVANDNRAAPMVAA